MKNFKNILITATTFSIDKRVISSLIFFLISAVAMAQCTYQLKLLDSWGDGWNGGGNIDVTIGTTTTNYVFANGNDTTINLSTNTGDSIIVNLIFPGTFANEVSFELYDPNNTAIYSSGSSPSTGRHYADTAICPSCISPSNLQLDSITTNSAILSWTENNAASSWEVEYDTAGFPQGTGNRSVINTKPDTLNGLNTNTAYEFYVRSICSSGDSSAWRGPLFFKTPCSSISSFPYYEGFENGVPPNCWSENLISGSNNWTANNGAGNSSGSVSSAYAGSNNASLYGSSGHSQLITPNFDLSVLNNPVLEFYHSQEMWGSDQDTLKVYYRSSASASWVSLATYSNDISSWTLESIPLPNPSNEYSIMFEGILEYGRGITIDAFEIKEKPSCNTPTALDTLDVTSASAKLIWTENNSATTWEIEYGSAGFTIGNGIDTTVNTNPFTLSGLEAGITYDWYVRSICGSNDTSAWVSHSFTTIFNAPRGVICSAGKSAGIIFSEEFNTPLNNWTGDIGTANGDWQINSGTTGSSSTGPSGAHSGSNYIFVESSSSYGDTATIVSPAYDLSQANDSAELSFWIHAYGAEIGNLSLGISTNASGPFTNIFNLSGELQQSEQAPYQQVGIRLDSYIGQTIYLQFSYVIGSSYTGDLAIDALEINSCISCPQSTNLTEDNLTGTSVDLKWSSQSTAPNFIIEYDTSGFTPGTGKDTIVSGSPFSLSGLNPRTDYQWRIRDLCGGNDSSKWTSLKGFTTPIAGPKGVNCIAGNSVGPAFKENFDDPTNNGWTGDIGTADGEWQVNSGSTTSSNTGPSAAHSGNNYIFVETSSGDSAKMVSPAIDLSQAADSAELSFWIHAYGATTGTLKVGVGTSASGPFTNIYSFSDELQESESAPYQQAGVRLDNYVGQTIYLQFSYYIGSSFTGDLAIDALEIDACFSCPQPINLKATNTTHNSSNLSWSHSGAPSSYILEYGVSGFSPGAGTDTIVSSSTISLNNLNASTTYDWYVKAICSPTDSSSWVSGSFSTPCVPSTAPYYTGFENSPTGKAPGCWFGYSTYSSGDVEVSSTDAYAGNNNLDLYNSGASSTDTLIAISPRFTDMTSGDKQLIFQSFSESTSNTLIVGTVSSQKSNASFNPLDTIIFAAIDTYQEVFVELTTANGYNGTDEYVAFAHSMDDTYEDMRIDEFHYETIPSCLRPTALALSSITDSSVTLNWTERGTASQWEVTYAPAGNPIGSGTQIISNTTSQALTNLKPSVAYEVYVRAICSSSDSSAWTSAAIFKTSCPTAFSAAYYNGFEYDEIGTMAECWTAFATYSNSSIEVDDLSPYSGGKVLDIYNSGASATSDTLAAISPKFSDLSSGNKRIRFYASTEDTSTSLIVGTMPSLSTTATISLIDTIKFTADDTYQEAIVEFTTSNGYNGTDEYIILIHDLNDTYTDIRVDEFNYENIPTCKKPFNLTSGTTTTSSVILDWTEANTATQWEVEYGPIGFSAGNGTKVSASSKPFTLSNLNSGTLYQWRVRSICSSSDTSLWSSSNNDFSTLCNMPNPVSLPFVQNFETVNGTLVGDGPILCDSIQNWNLETTSQTDGRARFGTNAVVSINGNGSITLDEVANNTPANDLILTLNLSSYSSSNDLDLSFKYMSHGDENHPNDSVWIRGSMNDSWIGAYDLITSSVQDGVTNNVHINLDSLLNAAGQSASSTFQVKFGQEDNSSATSSTGLDGISFDDVEIRGSMCGIQPSNLTATNSSKDTVDLDWTENSVATQWEIEYGIIGFNQGAGTKVIVSNKPFTLSGLNPKTTYEWYVRSICASGDSSSWSVVDTFATNALCATPASNLSTANISTDSVDLSWTENNSATQWEIEYGIIGFNQGSGTTVIVNNNPYSLMGLTLNTTYEWYVRSICASGDSASWSPADTFTTKAPPIPYYPIGTINTEDSLGVADSANVTAWTSGIVVGINLNGGNGLSFTIIDTANGVQEGIHLYSSTAVSGYTVSEGDSLKVRGTIEQFNGLTQLNVDSINIVSSGNAIPVPRVVNNLDESTESQYLEMKKFILLDTTGGAGNNYNLRAYNGNDTIVIRIDKDTDIDDSLALVTINPVPLDTFCLINGIGGQFDNNSPYTEGYQITPMRFADLILCYNMSDGINNQTGKKKDFSVFPNPTLGQFTLKSSGLEHKNARIIVRDITAKIVLNAKIEESDNSFTKVFDLSGHAKGLYFISIIDGNTRINKKLIVQ